MEDEVITTAAPQSDVVVTANTSPENTAGYVQVQEPTVDSSQSAAITVDQPTPPAPKTERELAYEEINRRQSESYSTKGNNISSWIQNDYNYDATQAGTLWVAGKINDVNTQMKFLEATLNEDLYSEMDLKKYFFDTNLATARAYAKEKKHETAYGFYRAAEEKAIAEGQLTGWYMPAEAGYMLSQWVLADEAIKDPNASALDKERAASVSRAVSGWFAANNITERGIECLNSLYLKETIRHNKEMERLQDDANQIQKAANAANNAANKANYEIQKKTFNFQLAEMELDMGFDLNKDNVIGHTGDNANRFGFYDDQKSWAQNNLDKAFKLWGSDKSRNILGDDYQRSLNQYKRSIQNTTWFQKQIESNNGYIAGENMDTFSNTKIKSSELKKIGINNSSDVTDNSIKMILIEDGGVALYVFNKHGVAYQITDDSIELSNGKTIKEVLIKQELVLDTTQRTQFTGRNSKGSSVTLNIGINSAKDYDHTISIANKDKYPGMSEKTIKAIETYTQEKGYNMEYGLIDTEWEPGEFVISKGEGDDKVYYAVDRYSGDVHKIKNKDKIAVVHINADGTCKVTHLSGEERTGFQKAWDPDRSLQIYALRQSEFIGTDKSIDDADINNGYMYTNHDGSKVFFTGEDIATGFDDFDRRSADRKYISESDARVINPNIDDIISARDNYINKEKPEVIKTGTPSDISNKDIEETTDGERKEIELNMNNSIKKDIDVRQINKKETDKPEHVVTKINKTEEEQVLEDYNKYVTAFAAGEVKRQVQEDQEDQEKSSEFLKGIQL